MREANATFTVAIMRSLCHNNITKHLDIGELDDISEAYIFDVKPNFLAFSG